MAPGKQAHQQQADNLLLADDDLVEFTGNADVKFADLLGRDFTGSSVNAGHDRDARCSESG